ncbi:hypothetical protein AHiyo8_05790 [Arthrobacter sp. Hiyo8]|nr:hypothetical protein AHiyo8_05790 [Arthrobacter sp. Hiyo8]
MAPPTDASPSDPTATTGTPAFTSANASRVSEWGTITTIPSTDWSRKCRTASRIASRLTVLKAAMLTK